MTLWQENLQRLVALIERKVAEEAICPFDYTQIDGWHRKNRAAGQSIIESLIRDEDARFKDAGSAMSLTLAGVRSSCTSGHFGLLRNWIRSARVKAGGPGTVVDFADPINLQGSGPAPIVPREGV